MASRECLLAMTWNKKTTKDYHELAGAQGQLVLLVFTDKPLTMNNINLVTKTSHFVANGTVM